MKIYSLLCHPEENSLNGHLFKTANHWFESQGHTVNNTHLLSIVPDLNNSALALYSSDEAELTSNGSNYRHNWANAKDRNLISTTVQAEIQKQKEADLFYIQTPIWLYSMPAMLKSYIEQIFLINEFFTLHNTGSATDFEVKHLIKNKRVIFCATTGGSEEMVANIVGGDSKYLIEPIKNIFEFIGFQFTPIMFWNVTDPATKDQRNFSSELTSKLAKLG
jgi:NAD(P)H dehydrogenase (quinone)